MVLLKFGFNAIIALGCFNVIINMRTWFLSGFGQDGLWVQMGKFIIAWALVFLLFAATSVSGAHGAGGSGGAVGAGNAGGTRGRIPGALGAYGVKAAFRAMNMPFSQLLFTNAMEDGRDLYFGDMKSFSFKAPLPAHIETQIRQAPSFQKAEAEVLVSASSCSDGYARKTFRNIAIRESNDAYYSLRGFYYGVNIEAVRVVPGINNNDSADNLSILAGNNAAWLSYNMSDGEWLPYDMSDGEWLPYDMSDAERSSYGGHASYELYKVQVVARDRYDFHSSFDDGFVGVQDPLSSLVRSGLRFALWQQEIGGLKNYDIMIGFNYYVATQATF